MRVEARGLFTTTVTDAMTTYRTDGLTWRGGRILESPSTRASGYHRSDTLRGVYARVGLTKRMHQGQQLECLFGVTPVFRRAIWVDTRSLTCILSRCVHHSRSSRDILSPPALIMPMLAFRTHKLFDT
ncbi:hypothetical protein EVAR_5412_1 [Eumeta japonica]|uniref:Uncharacterized protein n=1 Tax=Eumeta variegata TaxID=151549 RepID=A0A4C1T9H0_EUMVA|nr:hypothetical protein EVAR_5412_1 [Eumeta japonica]